MDVWVFPRMLEGSLEFPGHRHHRSGGCGRLAPSVDAIQLPIVARLVTDLALQSQKGPSCRDLSRPDGATYPIGAAGFEPAVSCPQSRRVNQASLRPEGAQFRADSAPGMKPLPDNR